jgi:hypothetical protein
MDLTTVSLFSEAAIVTIENLQYNKRVEGDGYQRPFEAPLIR